MTCAILIVAAGSGSRARRPGDITPKQYVPLAGKPVLSWSMETCLASPLVDQIQVVIAQEDEALYTNAIEACHKENRAQKLCPPVIGGGRTRQASVLLGLKALGKHALSRPDHVLIHDAARPFLTEQIIKNCLSGLKTHKACLATCPVTDTIKQVGTNGQIEQTLDRTRLQAAQTPQAFLFDFITEAHERAQKEGQNSFTDDAAIAEWVGEKVYCVQGDPANIKLTNRADLDMAEQKFSPTPSIALTDIRTGNGFDVHAFEPGKEVILGGIHIPHNQKLKGHSDADVALHAITDAILGAIADGDIGSHFPPSDPQWKGAPSDLFLKDAINRVKALGGKLSNIDLTIICEAPKIGPHRDAIRKSISDICQMDIARISVKATTTEKLGFTGRKEGIASLASICLRLPEETQ